MAGSDSFNIATACASSLAVRPTCAVRTAIVWEDESGATDRISFAELSERVTAMASALAGLGVGPGIALPSARPNELRPQSLLAVLHLGAVAVPLTVLFGPDALEYRLGNARCKIAICDSSSLPNDARDTQLAHRPATHHRLRRRQADGVLDWSICSPAGDQIIR